MKISVLFCAQCCTIFSLSGLIFLLIIGSLLHTQPLYIRGPQDPAKASQACYNAELNFIDCFELDQKQVTGPLLIKTTSGRVQGFINGASVRVWSGIRYAQAPVNNLRFSDPVSPISSPNDHIFNANIQYPGCPQVCLLPKVACPATVSEDCLFLTVTSPTTAPKGDDLYPVHVWIHGGSFVQGNSNSALYNATYFALNGIVTVSINYRLGALGYLAASFMGGNYGIKDQQLALKWVQANIKAFGGNPNAVTIGGESAGAMSVMCHLSMPTSQNLFKNAAMSSNPVGLPLQNRVSANAIASYFISTIGCVKATYADTLACLRAVPVTAIIQVQASLGFTPDSTWFYKFQAFEPMVDNLLIPDQPLLALTKGKFSTVKRNIFAGFNTDDANVFIFLVFPPITNALAYYYAVGQLFGPTNGAVIVQQYPYPVMVPNFDGRIILSQMMTDLIFDCPLRYMSQGYESVSPDKFTTFLYQFDHKLSFDPWNIPPCANSTCHADDLLFVFNMFSNQVDVSYNPTSFERDLAVGMNNAWSNFISSGNPKGKRNVPFKFPAYDATDLLSVLNVAGFARTQANYRQPFCSLWNTLGYSNLWGIPPPTRAPTMKPTPAVKKPLICQYSGYCKTDSDCYPGNYCKRDQMPYYSQCLANPSSYKKMNCLTNYNGNNKQCSKDSDCCDPGAYCNKNTFRQCQQPVKGSQLCSDPTGFAAKN